MQLKRATFLLIVLIHVASICNLQCQTLFEQLEEHRAEKKWKNILLLFFEVISALVPYKTISLLINFGVSKIFNSTLLFLSICLV